MEEIMLNENNIIETVGVTDNKGLLKIAGIGAAVIIVGGLTYKFAIKPLIAKFKAEKQENSQLVVKYTEE